MTTLLEVAGMKVFHATDHADAILEKGWKTKTDADRLIPNSISFSANSIMWPGKEILSATLNVAEDDILRLKLNRRWKHEDFYSKGGDNDTPLTIGKLWAKQARADGKKLIILYGVPYVGTEYAILDASIITNTTKFK